MSPGIAEEIIARQPPEAQAIIRALLAENAELKARIEALERQAQGKPPPELLAAAQHATSTQPAEAAEAKIQEETRRTARP